MKRTLTLIASVALLAGTATAFAQPDRMQGPGMAMHGPDHSDWKQGGHISHDDWGRGAKIDYREHHLRKPPRGYEWRQVDGNFVLAAAATGLIASVIMGGH